MNTNITSTMHLFSSTGTGQYPYEHCLEDRNCKNLFRTSCTSYYCTAGKWTSTTKLVSGDKYIYYTRRLLSGEAERLVSYVYSTNLFPLKQERGGQDLHQQSQTFV